MTPAGSDIAIVHLLISTSALRPYPVRSRTHTCWSCCRAGRRPPRATAPPPLRAQGEPHHSKDGGTWRGPGESLTTPTLPNMLYTSCVLRNTVPDSPRSRRRAWVCLCGRAAALTAALARARPSRDLFGAVVSDTHSDQSEQSCNDHVCNMPYSHTSSPIESGTPFVGVDIMGTVDQMRPPWRPRSSVG